MFFDSEAAKAFSCGKTKCSYLVNYGVAPYFLALLNTQVMELEHCIPSFDKSLNKIEKLGQTDLHIRLWDNSEYIVVSKYYSSEFLDKAAAADICLKCEKCLGPLQTEKVIPASSNGPNVNRVFSIYLRSKEEVRIY